MAVLVPLPKSSREVYGFLVEVAHIINSAPDSVVVQLDDKEIRVKSCCVHPSDDCEGMDFVLKGFVDDEEIEWVERFTSITIGSNGDETLLLANLFRPTLALSPRNNS